MRLITRMQLIRWHYFDLEIVDLMGESTVITGDNGTGKSTIIDALQMVLIGNQNKIKFNASAHEQKTDRSLIAYLRGKIGNSGEELQGYFLRNEDFTSYIAVEVEIENPKNNKKQYYIIGVVFDYIHRNKTEHHDFFKIDNCKLDNKLFMETESMPHTKEQFFQHLKKENLEYKKYVTIHDYNNDVRHLLGGIKESFYSLLQKGISFSPITNLRKFVYDYILESQEIDISLMQDFVEQSSELHTKIIESEQQIIELKEINKQYTTIEENKNKLQINSYIEKKVDVMIVSDELEELDKNITKEQKRLERNKEKQHNLKDKKEDLMEVKSNLLFEHASNDITVRQKQLDSIITTTKSEIQKKQVDNKNIKHQLRVEILERKKLLSSLEKYSYENSEINILKTQNEIFNKIEDSSIAFPFPDNLIEYNNYWNRGFEFINNKKSNLDNQIKDLQNHENELNETIKDLEKNQILPKTSPQIILKNLLIEKLSLSDSESIDLLCEVVEIKNENWKNAIEGYLNNQKFNVLVPPNHFKKALNIYEEYKKELKIENVGLVDTDKVLKQTKSFKNRSLANEIIINDNKDYVQAYVNYLLGDVIKCETVDELRNHNRAITESCMLYQGYVAKQISFKLYQSSFIGRNAIKLRLEKTKINLEEIREIKENSMKELESLSVITNMLNNKLERYEKWKNDWTNQEDIELLETQLIEHNEELFSLDTDILKEIEERIKSTDVEIKNYEDLIEKTINNIGRNENEIEKNEEEIVNKKEKLKQKEELFILFKNNLQNQQDNENDLINLAENEWNKQNKSKIEIREYYRDNTVQLQELNNSLFNKLSIMRNDFNNKYYLSYVTDSKINNDYDQFLKNLEDSTIVSYKEKSEELEEKARQSFIKSSIFPELSNLDDNTILGEFGIIENPVSIDIFGDCIMEVTGKYIDFSIDSSGISMYPTFFRNCKISKLNVDKIITIENKTTYHEYINFIQCTGKNELVIYLGVFHNNIRTILLKKLYTFIKLNQLNILFYHWGDIDLGGIAILLNLRGKTEIQFESMYMDTETFIENIQFGKEIQSKDYLKKLKKVLEKHEFEEFHDVIKLMIINNKTIEQEIIKLG